MKRWQSTIGVDLKVGDRVIAGHEMDVEGVVTAIQGDTLTVKGRRATFDFPRDEVHSVLRTEGDHIELAIDKLVLVQEKVEIKQGDGALYYPYGEGGDAIEVEVTAIHAPDLGVNRGYEIHPTAQGWADADLIGYIFDEDGEIVSVEELEPLAK